MNPKQFPLILFAVLLLWQPVFAQNAATGIFSNYTIDCNDGGASPDCSNTSPTAFSYIYTVPEDGNLIISGSAPDGSISCCGTTYNYSASGGIFPVGSANAYGYFGETSTSFTFDCVAAGTQYEMRFWGDVGSFLYNTSLIAAPNNDVEPNNNYNDATLMQLDIIEKGHIGYGSDYIDFYKIVIPYDSDLIVTTEFSSAGVVSIYDELANNYFVTQSISGGGQINLSMDCVEEGDVFNVLIQYFNDCSTYDLSYQVFSPVIPTDAEPNDYFGSALNLNETQQALGHIGYGAYNIDAADMYKIGINKNGNLSATCSFTGNGNLYLYDYSLNNILDLDIVTGGGFATITQECVAEPDSFVLVILQNGDCSEYILSYDVMSAPTENDQEPNNSLGQAEVLVRDSLVEGNVGYGFYSIDYVDFYMLIADEDGSINVNANFQNDGILSIYDSSLNSLLATDTWNGLTPLTLSLDCIAAGDVFLVLVSANGTCAGYELSYGIDTPVTDNDIEPNNSKADANSILIPDNDTGYLGHGFYSPDYVDFLDLGQHYIFNKIEFSVSVDGAPVTLNILRQGDPSFADVIGTYNNNTAVISYPVDISDKYYLSLLASDCATYSIQTEEYCPPQHNFSNVTIDGIYQASISLYADSTIVSPSAKFDAPFVELNSGFTVPLGKTLEVQIDGCN